MIEMDWQKRVSVTMRDKREELGLNHGQFAKLLGKCRTWVIAIENGDTDTKASVYLFAMSLKKKDLVVSVKGTP